MTRTMHTDFVLSVQQDLKSNASFQPLTIEFATSVVMVVSVGYTDPKWQYIFGIDVLYFVWQR